MSKMFAKLADFSTADVKPILSEQEGEEKGRESSRQSKELPSALSLAPTFATCNVVSIRFSYTVTLRNT